MQATMHHGTKKWEVLIRLAVLVTLGAWLAAPAEGCTTIVLRDGTRVVFGSSLDWNVDHGPVFANQRSMTRRTAGNPAFNTAKWVSRFGSVTFNIGGRRIRCLCVPATGNRSVKGATEVGAGYVAVSFAAGFSDRIPLSGIGKILGSEIGRPGTLDKPTPTE
jgi:hypothetical protein